jgi:trans-2,3-dihydro-3-hydroxyanthranilate isomerase
MTWLTTKRISTFTKKAYAGNPAWVVIGADAHEDEKKLVKLASELNPISDTVFVFPKSGSADLYLRFFSQSEEIGFSGHGTIATYLAIENEDIIAVTEPITLVRQKSKAGTQYIELRVKAHKIERVTVSLPSPQFVSTQFDVKQIARLCGIPPVDVLDSTYPIGAVALSGNTDILVPVTSCDALFRMSPNFPLLKNYCDRYQMTGVVAWCLETLDDAHNVSMRHFAPSVGINEDPVSGAAGAALGCYLVHNRVMPVREMSRIVVEQGCAMDRPGTVYIHVHTHSNEILKVTFGGQGVITFEGRVALPED